LASLLVGLIGKSGGVPAAPDPDELVARLYASAPEDFVKARAEGARQLKSAGLTDEAAQFAKLTKPSLSAWAVNLLVNAQGELVDAVVECGDTLRQVHTGGGGLKEIRAAQQARHDAIRTATDTAAELAGRPLSEAHREEISATLEAASSDSAAAEAVRTGQLVRPLAAPTGFDMVGLTVITGGRATARRGRDAPESDAADADDKARQARDTMLRADADAATAAADAAEVAATELRTRVEELEEARQRLDDERRQIDDQLSSARRQLREAERAATDAARKASRAATRADRSRR
jgi:hypothetical protein